jgi:ADP-heptose:LPS heptosyltransferase
VIKHGALGDFILALGPFQAVRAHHLGDHVTLLTTTPFAEMARASGYFDDVWIDDRPAPWRLGALLGLRRRLRQGDFARVYDLQTSTRSSFYFHLFPRRHAPEWSGVARGCSHPHANPDRDYLHTIKRQAEQLELAGIPYVPAANLDWLRADVRHLVGGANFVLLAPGGSAHRPGKRWPAASYAKLARMFAADGVKPVLIGAAAEASLTRRVAADCHDALDLAGRTSLAQLAELARHARGAIGNDNGAMHLAAAVGCASLVLFSADSDPALCAPHGRAVGVLRHEPLSSLSVESVAGAFAGLARSP